MGVVIVVFTEGMGTDATPRSLVPHDHRVALLHLHRPVLHIVVRRRLTVSTPVAGRVAYTIPTPRLGVAALVQRVVTILRVPNAPAHRPSR